MLPRQTRQNRKNSARGAPRGAAPPRSARLLTPYPAFRVSNFVQTAALNGRRFSVLLAASSARKPMADRTEELRGTAAQCLALAQSTPDPLTRAALITLAQKLYKISTPPPAKFTTANPRSPARHRYANN